MTKPRIPMLSILLQPMVSQAIISQWRLYRTILIYDCDLPLARALFKQAAMKPL